MKQAINQVRGGGKNISGRGPYYNHGDLQWALARLRSRRWCRQSSTGREGRVGILDGPSSSEVLRNGTLEMCVGGGSPWRFIGHSLVGVGDLTS